MRQAYLYEKAICAICRFSFHAKDGFLRCTQTENQKIPKDILTGDRTCPEFKRRDR
jgi:hypothetical protein